MQWLRLHYLGKVHLIHMGFPTPFATRHDASATQQAITKSDTPTAMPVAADVCETQALAKAPSGDQRAATTEHTSIQAIHKKPDFMVQVRLKRLRKRRLLGIGLTQIALGFAEVSSERGERDCIG
jgi:hypothetical protein